MPFLKLPYPNLADPEGYTGVADKIVDPASLMANFYAIYRLLNGNLGAENLLPGTKFPPGTLRNARSFAYVMLNIDLGVNTLPANAEIFRLPQGVAARLDAVAVAGASSDFVATLTNVPLVGSTTMAVLGSRDGKSDYLIDQPQAGGAGTSNFGIVVPDLAVQSKVRIDSITGTCRALMLSLTMAHSA